MRIGTMVRDKDGKVGEIVAPSDYGWLPRSYPTGYVLVLFPDWHIPQWVKRSLLESRQDYEYED